MPRESGIARSRRFATTPVHAFALPACQPPSPAYRQFRQAST